MTTQRSIFTLIRDGIAAALGHWRLVLAFYLVPLIPALLWAWVAHGHLQRALGDRPFAQEIMGGNALGVVQDFLAGPENQLGALFGALFPLSVLAVLLTIAVVAGTAPVLLGHGGRTPFLSGVAHYTGRYLRSLIAFLAMLAPGVVFVIVATGVGRVAAESQYDERFQYLAVVIGLLLWLALYIPLDLAYDLSRLAAADHDGRRTFRGYFKALLVVVRRPVRMVSFYLIFLVVIVVFLWLFSRLRGSLVMTSGGTLLMVFAVQQMGMLIRSFWQVSFWGAEVALYRDLGSPDWCGAPRPETTEATESYALPGEPLPAEPIAEDQVEAEEPSPRPSLSTVAPRAPGLTEPIEPVREEELRQGEERRRDEDA